MADRRPDASDEPEHPDRPGQPGQPEQRQGSDGGPDEQPHRDTGLDLARSIARSVAGRAAAAGPGSARRSGRGGRGGDGRRRRRTDPQSSGAHPDDRDPQTLDATIGRFIAQQGWQEDVRVHGVFSRWGALVGEEVARHAQPVSYVRDGGPASPGGGEPGGRLVVQTDSTAWATQMRLLAPTVLVRLNKELGEGTVTFLEVRGPAAPRWSHGRRSVRGGRGPRDTYG